MAKFHVSIHTEPSTTISCTPLFSEGWFGNTLKVGGATIFADNADLRRLAGVINARLAAIDTAAEPIAA
jgi:hypothetical protein